MRIEKKLSWLFAGLLVLAMLLMFAARSEASGDRITQSNDMNNQTTGDVTVGASASVTAPTSVTTGDTNFSSSSRAYALSNSLGDVDIAACLGSTQWNTPVYGRQKLVLNQVCMAEFYLKTGKFELAAMSLCNVPEIIKEFESEEVCELAHDFSPPPVPAPVSRYEPEIAHDEDMEIVHMQQAGLVEQLDHITAQLEAVQSQPPPEPVVIRQQVEYSDEQVSAVWAALGKGSEEDE